MAKPLKENVCEEHLFNKIYNQYSTHLFNFLYYKFGDTLQPQDKVQEAFINEYNHQKVVLKYQQKQTKKVNHQDPQFLVEEKEYLEKFQNALAKLTEAQRVAFMMNRTEGKKHKEIAEILGISRKAVEKRIYSALKKLREDLKEI